MINLGDIKGMVFDGNTVEKIAGETQGVFWERVSDFTRSIIHSEDQQFINTGIMNTGDYIFEGRFRLNYIDPPNNNGDGNWLFGGRKNGSNTVGVFFGVSGSFNAYGGASASYQPKVTANKWYTYYFSRGKYTLTDDDGNIITFPVTNKTLVPENQGIEMRICSISGNYAGTGEDMRRMWGDHDYHKCMDAITGDILYQFVAGVDKEGIACFKNEVNGQLKYSDSGKQFETVDELLSKSFTDLNTLGIYATNSYETNKTMLNKLGVD